MSTLSTISKTNGTVSAERDGQSVPLPQAVSHAFSICPFDVVVTGVITEDTLIVHDLLRIESEDQRHTPALLRRKTLEELFTRFFVLPSLKLIETAAA